ncbi:MAG: phospholipid carrier-dependent glycosyltransferase [Clostridiales bacterium]|nr:phospholipid carrier-dependent glycosyltransferase [Clostridiales bacterium]
METLCVLGIEIVIGLVLLYTEGIIHPAKEGYLVKQEPGETIAKHDRKEMVSVIVMFLAAVVVRVLAHVICPGHDVDRSCFTAWATRLSSEGFHDFYQSGGFSDYPPVYLYILWLIGKTKELLKLSADSVLFGLLLKMPALIADLACGFLLYRLSCKHLKVHRIAMVLMAMYLFNPVVILNSAMWGQVDSILALFMLLLCYALTERKMLFAYIIFGFGILFKPQMIFLAPVMLAGFIDRVFFHQFTLKKLGRELMQIILVAVSGLLLCMPFQIKEVAAQYMDTLSSYPYTSVNAFNLWGIFGKCWVRQDQTFFFLEYETWGMIFVTLVIAATLYLFIRFRKEHCRFFQASAFAVAGIFLFSVRMHERYLFPVLLLLLAAFIYKPAKEIMCSYIFFSALHFCNEAYSLYLYDPDHYQPHKIWTAVFSVLTLGVFIYFSLYCARQKQEKTSEISVSGLALLPEGWFGGKEFYKERMVSEKHLRFQRSDLVAIIAITAVYSCFAMYNLGSTKVPQSAFIYDDYECNIQLLLPENTRIKEIAVYNGNYEQRRYNVSAFLGERFTGDSSNFEVDEVFAWHKNEVLLTGNRLDIHGLNEKGSILELVLLNEDGEPVCPENAGDYPGLFDEQECFVKESTFRDSTYFDEIYHARTAYEYIHGLYSYENTHPPLGKILISAGIRIFGMNPFGWRFMGTLFGILMVPVFYLFSRKLFRSTWVATVATLLFTFDFMHFTQSRIATIDVFVTFFIIVMYYFMYQYITVSFYDRPLHKTFIPLGLCGVFMGFAIASKWTGIYGAVGLAVLFFVSLYHRLRESLSMELETRKKKAFVKKSVITLSFCVLMFLIVPGIIYLGSYIPFVNADGDGLVKRMLLNQTSMFSYHSGLEDTHAYASRWYTWPVIWKPMWYYAKTLSSTMGEGITAMGNPLVWWAGIPAFFHMIYLWLRKRDQKAGFLIIAYLSQLEPWMFISRTTFIYHYMPSTPFVALMVAYSLYQIYLWRKEWKPAIYVYTGAACVLFFMYYPVLSGVPVWRNYVYMVLRWLPNWHFLYS